MHADVDHNFLLNCMKNAEWRELLIEVHESAAVRIVLSPYHLYEIGNARKYDDTEDLVKFVEQRSPTGL
ncbi:hypothetical protein HDF14_001096 [Edaphobacter lichenicola]|jgi:hypothetical protein|uniref:Uncharacterized protein n=1 Tax=Tunturiibacter gelidiferens TaxID=3069689 RepID=A0A9X0QBR3_9BACT|nr:hypothetical protein [Edaphobacter lichenicola]